MHVLIAEDEKKTATFIQKALKAEGFAVDVVANGHDALSFVATGAFDAVVLDIMMPGPDGLTVLRQMRGRNILTPVLLLSARGAAYERVDGLDAGADDYLSKPFVLAELVARIRALCRRSPLRMPAELRIGDFTLDTVKREARRGVRRLTLVAKEYQLLEFLMRVPDRVYSRATILQGVWEMHFDQGGDLLDVYIKRLRDKITAGGETQLLHNVRGVGYVIREEP